MSKILVAYFSVSGVTAGVAKFVARTAGADLYEITPKVPYTKEDLSWQNRTARTTVEMHDLSSRPEIIGRVENMDQYDKVLIGFPIWWYAAPTIINTFLEAHDLAGKTIGLFATSGGSGAGKAVNNLRGSVADSVVWAEPKLLNGEVTKEDIVAWIEGM